MRAVLPLGGLLAAVAVWGLWQGRTAECTPGQTVVLGRVGDAPKLDVLPQEVEAHKQRVGVATRTALPLSISKPIEIPVVADVTDLRFSLGSLMEVMVTVSVQAEWTDGRRTELHTVEIEGPTPEWRDYRVKIDRAEAKLSRIIFGASSYAELADDAVYLGGVMLAGPSPCEDSLSTRREKPLLPNIVIVSLDTLGADKLGLHSGGRPITPFLDSFRQKGADLREALVTYPNTIVSHASLFTGLYPRHHQVYGGIYAAVKSTTLAEILGSHGYLTAAFTEDAYVGSNFKFDKGFDSYDDGEHSAAIEFGGDAAVTFRKATDWLANLQSNVPLLLFIHTYEVHSPYDPRDLESWSVARDLMPDYRGPFAEDRQNPMVELRHNTGREELPEEDLAFLRARHLGEVSYLDRQVKELMGAIDQKLASDRTILIVTADHGEEFGEHGFMGHGETLSNLVLRVPLFIHWQGKIQSRVSDVPVSSVDLLPTLLDLIGLPPLRTADGRSFANFLRGTESAPASRPIFADLANALGLCRRANLPDGCLVDQVSARWGNFKMIDALLPRGTRMYDLTGGEEREVEPSMHPREADMLRALLDYYRGIAPIAIADKSEAPSVDKDTEQRLRALGYL